MECRPGGSIAYLSNAGAPALAVRCIAWDRGVHCCEHIGLAKEGGRRHGAEFPAEVHSVYPGHPEQELRVKEAPCCIRAACFEEES